MVQILCHEPVMGKSTSSCCRSCSGCTAWTSDSAGWYLFLETGQEDAIIPLLMVAFWSRYVSVVPFKSSQHPKNGKCSCEFIFQTRSIVHKELNLQVTRNLSLRQAWDSVNKPDSALDWKQSSRGIARWRSHVRAWPSGLSNMSRGFRKHWYATLSHFRLYAQLDMQWFNGLRGTQSGSTVLSTCNTVSIFVWTPLQGKGGIFFWTEHLRIWSWSWQITPGMEQKILVRERFSRHGSFFYKWRSGCGSNKGSEENWWRVGCSFSPWSWNHAQSGFCSSDK